MARRRKAQKRISRPERARIIKAAEKQGLTAMQVEKKFGVSRWTFYGWRKRKGGAGRPGRRAAAGGPCTCNCAAEMQTILPGLIREQLTLALRDLLLGAAVQRRGRRPRK